ncbi:MAG: ATP-binding protein [Colwellia sp.]|nr:ATP-binding protein [Colwellia sp.]
MNRTSVSFALARFVFLSCLGLALITFALVVNYVISAAQKDQEKVIKREITSISNNYKVFLEHRITLLTEQSTKPLVIQTLMQPEYNKGKIQDFMSDLTLLGKHYDESLLDFEGNIIHSTSKKSLLNYKDFDWLKKMLDKQITSHIDIVEIDGNFYWCLSVPVLYNKNVEGILTANIPIENINEVTDFNELVNGLMIEIIQFNKVLSQFGNSSEGRQKEIKWPELNVVLRFTIDEDVMDSELSNIILQLSTLIILAIILTSLLAYFYGYRYFVKPILMLSKATDEFDKGNDFIPLQDDLRIKELADLFKKFNKMTAKVAKREQDLKYSYEKLSEANHELKQSESQLVQSEKLASIGVLAAGVAHEINNPIGFIKSNLEVFEDYILDIKKYYQETQKLFVSESQQQSQLKLAKKYEVEFLFNDITPLLESSIGGVERVTEIVQSLKIFARTDQPDKVLVDINEGLEATLTMVKNELKYSCRIHVDLQELPKILAYPGKLNQVFMNLLINAGQSININQKSNIKSGDIYVRSFVSNEQVVVEIEDTGCGISDDKLLQIFTPFYTSKPIGEGTGLGLSISQQIIEQHLGKIRVRSKIDEGSCFSIFLPIKTTI